ncbi:Dihydroorotate dehydrogenase B (NAD(+)), catalytic subunit [Candidatus Sulfotelmatomonas gaucii]|uniref:Dihydroorotate dehydrogenase n=1 Tax=Candidatus Sulfuritelmatomonas gaucii TaxID=2043161 RepID=A0A2N9LLI1_9BACT|nr:Dihydroorotate dehydrogenase B (NAD(+)), catalytic subunit [Candidatus Sulfotelmatomonas gaucii]
MKPDMKVSFAGLELVNPIIAASGTFGYGIEFEEIVSLERVGAVVTKGVSLEPMAGHTPTRIVPTAAGMLNAIGLQNVGVEEFVEKKLPPMQRYPNCRVIVNVFGQTASDYVAVIDRLNDAEGIAAYELNVSCPNVHAGGMSFGADPYSLEELVDRTKKVAIQPLMVKLSPNVTSISYMARICEEAGADAVSLVNTFLAMSIDAEERKPRLSNVTGGLSGPAIKPIALRMVYEVANTVNIPVIGMGGIVTPEDVVEFLLAGATAVQVGTASYADPRATERLARGLEAWCKSHDVEKVTSLTRGLKAGGKRLGTRD